MQLQSWSLGGQAGYWIVKTSAAALAIPPPIQQSSSGVTSELDELHRLEQQEIKRLEQLEQDYITQEAKLEDSDNSPRLHSGRLSLLAYR